MHLSSLGLGLRICVHHNNTIYDIVLYTIEVVRMKYRNKLLFS